MVKGLIILADGFQDSEALATRDVLKRSRLQVDTASIHNSLEVQSQTGLVVKADLFLKDAKSKDYDFLIIPGGSIGVSNLNKEKMVDQIINEFVEDKKLVAAICAGPSVVGKSLHYDSRSYTCFPGMEKYISGGKYQKEKPVIRDGNFITAKSMAYSVDFALEIIEYLQGKEQRASVLKNIRGEL